MTNYRSFLNVFSRILIVAPVLFIISVNPISAQRKNDKTATQDAHEKSKKSKSRNNTEVKKEKQNNAEKQAEPAPGDLVAFLQLGPALPGGAISDVAKTGFGFTLGADAAIPLPLPVLLRAGASLGYYTMTTENIYTGKLNLMPVILYAKAVFPVESTPLTPYVSIGFGGTSVASEVPDQGFSQSSFDGTFSIGLGADYAIPKVAGLSVNVAGQYLMIFEVPDSAGLALILLGVSYKL